MTDLAGIVARDAEAAAEVPSGRTFEDWHVYAAVDRRALLALLRETRDAITAVVNDSESQHPVGWGPDVTTVAFLREALDRLAALDTSRDGAAL